MRIKREEAYEILGVEVGAIRAACPGWSPPAFPCGPPGQPAVQQSTRRGLEEVLRRRGRTTGSSGRPTFRRARSGERPGWAAGQGIGGCGAARPQRVHPAGCCANCAAPAKHKRRGAAMHAHARVALCTPGHSAAPPRRTAPQAPRQAARGGEGGGDRHVPADLGRLPEADGRRRGQ